MGYGVIMTANSHSPNGLHRPSSVIRWMGLAIKLVSHDQRTSLNGDATRIPGRRWHSNCNTFVVPVATFLASSFEASASCLGLGLGNNAVHFLLVVLNSPSMKCQVGQYEHILHFDFFTMQREPLFLNLECLDGIQRACKS